MKQSVNYVQSYTLTDFFDRTFRMIRASWKISLFGGLAVVGPAAIFLAIVVPLQIRSVVAISLEAAEYTSGAADTVGGLVLWNGLAIVAGLLYAAAALWARLAVVHTVRDGVISTAPRWTDAVRAALRVSLLPVIGQTVLKIIIGAAIVTVPTVLLLLVAVGGGWTPPLLAAFVYVAAGAVITWFFISLLFSAEAVVFDGEGVVGGMKKSWLLVRGSWWRLVGISLLVAIMISFVSGLVTTPIVGATFLPITSRLIDAFLSENVSDEAILGALANTRPFAVAIGLATIVQQLISLLFVPVFYSLFYVDLKVRHGELETTRDQ